MVGLSGGFGWIMEFNNTAPRSIDFQGVEIYPGSILLISIPYPPGTTVEVSAIVAGCGNSVSFTCTEVFKPVSSIEAVRSGPGNGYHMSSDGVLTFRLAHLASSYTGNPTWSLPDYTTLSTKRPDDVWELQRFEREGIILPRQLRSTNYYHVQATCPGDNNLNFPKSGYCPQKVNTYDPEVCAAGFVQTGYDKCCQLTDNKKCIFSDGSKNF